MIRFVDLRPADIVGHNFAFWDTVRDRFFEIDGIQAWETWKEFHEEATDDPVLWQQDQDRLEGLMPEWTKTCSVDDDEDDDEEDEP